MLLSPPVRCRALLAHMESGQARVHSGVRPLAPLARPSRSPITPAWLQSPEHLRRPGDCRSYCHAPARLWPSVPSTDSLRPHAPMAHPRRPSVPDRRPASAQMPGQAGHNGEAVTVGSRQTLHSSPWRSFRCWFSVCQPCRFNPSQPPTGGAITPGLRRRFESPPVPGSAS